MNADHKTQESDASAGERTRSLEQRLLKEACHDESGGVPPWCDPTHDCKVLREAAAALRAAGEDIETLKDFNASLERRLLELNPAEVVSSFTPLGGYNAYQKVVEQRAALRTALERLVRAAVSVKQGESGMFAATLPDAPGCVAQGATRDEAIAQLCEAFVIWATHVRA